MAQDLHIKTHASESCRIYFRHLPYMTVQILYATNNWQPIIVGSLNKLAAIVWSVLSKDYTATDCWQLSWHKVCIHDGYNILLVSYMQDLCQVGACKNCASYPLGPNWDILLYIYPTTKIFPLITR